VTCVSGIGSPRGSPFRTVAPTKRRFASRGFEIGQLYNFSQRGILAAEFKNLNLTDRMQRMRLGGAPLDPCQSAIAGVLDSLTKWRSDRRAPERSNARAPTYKEEASRNRAQP